MKIEKTEVVGLEHAIRGMRNPKNSWSKSDSALVFDDQQDEWKYQVGENDHRLMMTLASGGPVHAKYRRMITVYADIIAPAFWISELDTYKVGTVRNSCSLQHKGASRDFTIRDFTVDERLYEILDPDKPKKEHPLIYPYETDEFRRYYIGERSYRIYRNGRVISEEFATNEGSGRKRVFPEREVLPSQNSCGYYYLNIGGRYTKERWVLHRLVAEVWLKKPIGKVEINHKDMNKGNNSVENLEWVTHQENEIHKRINGGSGRTIRTDYLAYKNSSKISLYDRLSIHEDYHKNGIKTPELAKKYGISQAQAYVIAVTDDEKRELFEEAELWEETINTINTYRQLYVETRDYNYFRQMRMIMPMGYNYRFTWMANYEVLSNIYKWRKDHKLSEWHTFCDWIKSLPYSELITGEEKL